VTHDTPTISGQHRAMLAIEFLHAAVVLTVVIAVTIVYVIHAAGFPQDLLGFVYSAAIGYAGGRASSARGALVRAGDKPADDS
jgi:hypothetical protein